MNDSTIWGCPECEFETDNPRRRGPHASAHTRFRNAKYRYLNGDTKHPYEFKACKGCGEEKWIQKRRDFCSYKCSQTGENATYSRIHPIKSSPAYRSCSSETANPSKGGDAKPWNRQVRQAVERRKCLAFEAERSVSHRGVLRLSTPISDNRLPSTHWGHIIHCRAIDWITSDPSWGSLVRAATHRDFDQYDNCCQHLCQFTNVWPGHQSLGRGPFPAGCTAREHQESWRYLSPNRRRLGMGSVWRPDQL